MSRWQYAEFVLHEMQIVRWYEGVVEVRTEFPCERPKEFSYILEDLSQNQNLEFVQRCTDFTTLSASFSRPLEDMDSLKNYVPIF